VPVLIYVIGEGYIRRKLRRSSARRSGCDDAEGFQVAKETRCSGAAAGVEGP
jgi:hypothetical protein